MTIAEQVNGWLRGKTGTHSATTALLKGWRYLVASKRFA